MAFRTLGEVLQTARAQGMIDGLGELGVDAPAQPPRKGPERYAPAKSFREVLPAKEVHANREMIIAPPNGLPRPAVIISLVVDNEGGRTTQGRKLDRPTYRRNSWRERARETGIVLVHSAAS